MGLLVALSSIGITAAQDLTLDPDLYNEALRQVQGGSGIVSTKTADEDLIKLWEEAMLAAKPTAGKEHEAQLARQLRLCFLFKQLNNGLSLNSMAELIALHERAISGDLAAQTSILQALQSGIDAQQRLWPRSEKTAKSWMKHISQ